MSPQYRILSELLKLLKMSHFACSSLPRVECLIYRLKLILLSCDGYGVAELDRLCPVAVLEELRRLVAEADTTETAAAVVLLVISELEQLIQQLENALPAVAARDVEVQKLRSRVRARMGAEI